MSTSSCRPRSATRRRASSACGSDSVIPVTCTPCRAAAWMREAPPSAADVEHALAGLQRELRAHQLELLLLGLLERATRRARTARSCRSSTGPGTARRTRAAGRSGGARRARRARGCGGGRVGAARRPAARGGQAQAAARGRPRAAAAPARSRSSGGGCQRSSISSDGVEVVHRQLARHVGAAHAELSGRPQRRARRRPGSGPEGRGRLRWSRPRACRPTARPRTGAPGERRSSSPTSGAVRANGTRGMVRLGRSAGWPWRAGVRDRCAPRPTRGRPPRARGSPSRRCRSRACAARVRPRSGTRGGCCARTRRR